MLQVLRLAKNMKNIRRMTRFNIFWQARLLCEKMAHLFATPGIWESLIT